MNDLMKAFAGAALALAGMVGAAQAQPLRQPPQLDAAQQNHVSAVAGVAQRNQPSNGGAAYRIAGDSGQGH